MNHLLLIAVLILLTGFAELSRNAPELLVHLKDGSPIRGPTRVSYSGRGIRAFKNIPYAEAPVGKLRFTDPVPKAPWTAELESSNEVIMCPQQDNVFLAGMYLGQEDCLYLHVYVPLHPHSEEPLPVMLYLHGGGFANGAGDEFLYGPEFLLDKDVIFVTGNYRILALGFLYTGTDDFPGNYGMKDQTLMMKWIQENIEVFGGDPKRVTIFGESAGGSCVGYHMLSPLSQGLFQQAILQSGTAFESWANFSAEKSIGMAEKLFDLLECPYAMGNYTVTLECMKQKEAKDMVLNMKQFKTLGHQPFMTFGPVKEKPGVGNLPPFITPADFSNVLGGSEIPVMVGMTTNDGAFFAALTANDPQVLLRLEENFDIIADQIYLSNCFGNETFKEKVEILKQRYLKRSPYKWAVHHRELTNLFTEFLFKLGISEMLRRRVKTGAKAPTFVYQFNYRGSVIFTDLVLGPGAVNLGVGHVDDLMYLFPWHRNLFNQPVMTKDDQVIKEDLVEMWTNFAITGNPSTDKIKWEPIQEKFPIDFLRIGNCNLDNCEPFKVTLSEMQTGFFEKDFELLEEFFENCDN